MAPGLRSRPIDIGKVGRSATPKVLQIISQQMPHLSDSEDNGKQPLSGDWKKCRTKGNLKKSNFVKRRKPRKRYRIGNPHHVKDSCIQIAKGSQVKKNRDHEANETKKKFQTHEPDFHCFWKTVGLELG